jgi:hypothetical protein
MSLFAEGSADLRMTGASVSPRRLPIDEAAAQFGDALAALQLQGARVAPLEI